MPLETRHRFSRLCHWKRLSRESLYKALSGERSPGFDTILKVIGALGLKLHAEASETPNPSINTDAAR